MKHKYTDSLYYHVKLTEKLLKILCKQIEDDYDLPLTIDECIVLDIIDENNGKIHQRDLAKLLFKDRANTGKLLNNLEAKNYIERKEVTKNKRLVKIMNLTQKGHDLIKKFHSEIFPIFAKIENRLSSEDENTTKRYMQSIRDIVTELIEIDI